VGIGELGLMPVQFWDLTWHEFHVKHEAFLRHEDRARALVFELAGLIGLFSNETTQRKVNDSAVRLRRYPIKPWVHQPK